MTEIVRDGFNVVVTECDGCGEIVEQIDPNESDWLEITISPLARDKWNAGDDLATYHFCSPECLNDNLSLLQQNKPA
ncbi:MAG: hypothetical protein ABEK50_00805 [bacterium]